METLLNHLPPTMRALTLNDAKIVLNGVSTVLDALPIPDPFKSAISAVPTIALKIVQMAEGAKKNKEDATELAIYITNLSRAIVRALETKGTSQITPEMVTGISELTAELLKVSENVKKLKSRNPWKRHFGFSEDSVKLASFKERISQARGLLEFENLLAVRVAVEQIRQEQIEIKQEQIEIKQEQISQGEMQLIDRLGSGDTGTGDKERACLEGTRENVLQDIETWVEDPQHYDKRILWLTGPAGTGKSAIVASMERRLKAKGQLGAVFYFVREQPARNKQAILKIARQLALRQPLIRAKIVDALKADQDLPENVFTEQYRLLFEEPLSSLRADSPPLTIMFDALDECDETFMTTILRRVVQSMEKFPPQVRFLFSSRIETYIRAVLQTSALKSKIEQRPLDDETLDVVTRDIEAYLRVQLPLAVQKFGTYEVDWPGPARMKALARMANGLFIWAATILTLVADANERDPESQIERVLNSPSLMHLDELYRNILDQAFSSRVSTGILQLLRSILGTLVTAQESLNTTTLAELVGSSAGDVRRKVLDYLYAVLLVPQDDASSLRFVHQSFVDFITASESCDVRFLIETADHHRQMALACFRCMEALRKNMCDLQPWEMHSDITDLEHRIDMNMSRALRYACRYWDAHLMKSGSRCEEVYEALRSFAYERMLLWLEALSLMGRTPEAVHMARSAETWMADSKAPQVANSETVSILRDFQRFVMRCRGAISESSIHIYISALPSVPVDTALWKVYRKGSLDGPRVTYRRGRLQHWPAGLWTGTGHTKSIVCLVFSPDGRTIVSGSWDQTLRVWDASSGAAIGKPLEGHTSSIDCLAFSPDGRTIVSGSEDQTLRVWDASSGAAIGKPLEGHTSSIRCLAFSPDGRTIVSGSDDQTLRLWDASSGAAIGKPLEGHTMSIECLAFSPDGRTIVSGSWDHTLRLWDASSGAAIGKPLEGHTNSIWCLAFSPDGRTIVSGSEDHTLRLWDASSGAAIGKPLEGHTDSIVCLAFSPDGRTIVSRDSGYRTITWDVALHKQADISIPRKQAKRLLASAPEGADLEASDSGWITSSVTNRKVFWTPDIGKYTRLAVHGNVCAVGTGVVSVVDLSECHHAWSLNEIDRSS